MYMYVRTIHMAIETSVCAITRFLPYLNCALLKFTKYNLEF